MNDDGSWYFFSFSLVTQQEVIVGDEVLQIPSNSKEYNVHFPFKNGDVNRHSGIGKKQFGS